MFAVGYQRQEPELFKDLAEHHARAKCVSRGYCEHRCKNHAKFRFGSKTAEFQQKPVHFYCLLYKGSRHHPLNLTGYLNIASIA